MNPSIWSLEPDLVFLNHGSFGACPDPVLEFQAALRARMERQPVQFLTRDLEGLIDDARRSLGEFIGGDPEGLAPVSNATEAVNAVVGSLDLHPGDEIVVTDHGYNACANVVSRAAERSGATVRTVSLPFSAIDPDLVFRRVVDAVGDHTVLVLVDHVTSPTALVLPVERIVAELEGRGVPVLVDGAHAPGMLELDVDALGCSWYAGNCHKWMCAPKGAGFLYARADRRHQLVPAVLSHGYNSPRTDRSRYHLQFDWTGTDDPTAFLCVPEAIRQVGALHEDGWPGLRAAGRALALEGRRLVAEAVEADDLPPEAMVGSMAAVPVDDLVTPASHTGRSDPLNVALLEEDRIEVPVVSWPRPPHRMLRISATPYNTEADMQRLADALRRRGVRASGAPGARPGR